MRWFGPQCWSFDGGPETALMNFYRGVVLQALFQPSKTALKYCTNA
jgi:hypothetical protein